jgi:hypothetical protein
MSPPSLVDRREAILRVPLRPSALYRTHINFVKHLRQLLDISSRVIDTGRRATGRQAKHLRADLARDLERAQER